MRTEATFDERVRACAESAFRIRMGVLEEAEAQGEGYVGQALGAADILAVIYRDTLRFKPADPDWVDRDRFLLSIGHYGLLLYAALADAGVIPWEELTSYAADDSRLPMSAMSSYCPGTEISGGHWATGSGWASACVWACAPRAAASSASSPCSATASSTRAPPGRRR